MNATYITIIDDFDQHSRECQYDESTGEVMRIKGKIPEGEVTEEFVELPDFSVVNSFYNKDEDYRVFSGLREELYV